MLALPLRQCRFRTLRLANVEAAIGRAAVARQLGRPVRIPLVTGRRDITGVEIHHYDAAVCRDETQDLIVNVTRVIDDRARGGVGKI